MREAITNLFRGTVPSNFDPSHDPMTVDPHDEAKEGVTSTFNPEPIPQASINNLSGDEYNEWKEKQRAKINQLPDGPQKTALLKMLDGHETFAWTKDEFTVYQLTLKTAEAGAGIVDNDPYI